MSDVTSRVELAKVIHVVDSRSPFDLIINRGARDGVKPGHRFLIFGYGPEVTDPDSGENLGRIELVRGRGEIVHVQDHLSTIRSIERRPEHRGRRVIRDTTAIGLALRRGHVIEEDWPAEEKVPFRDVAIGDLAKAI